MKMQNTVPAKAPVSRLSLLLCCILLTLAGSVFYARWEKYGGEAQLSWDAGGYYWYLPSAFIYKDLAGQHFKDSILRKYEPTPPNDFQYAFKPDRTGNYVIRYTIGTAVLEALPFFIAHNIAEPMGYPADGFSRPYEFTIYLAGLLFAITGLVYLRKLLLFYYSDRTVAITLFLLVFGTNYLNYAGIDVGMTHTWLFTLYVFILLNTHYLYRTFKTRYLLRLGFLTGFTALVRPPEIISVLIPLLWGLNSLSAAVIRERLQLFLTHLRPMLAALFIGLSVLGLQFLYWKTVSGHWFIYTYQEQGFSWLNPHIRKYALNYECGWLTYTPLMFFAIAGIFPFLKSGNNKVAVLTLILLNYYIVAAWNAWNYGGRAMIQNYPLLLFPLASFVQFISGVRWRKWVFAPLLLLCVYFNIWWTYQAHGGGLVGNVPGTAAYYRASVLRYHLPLEIQKLHDNDDLYYGTVTNADTLYYNPIPDSAAVIVNDAERSFTFRKPAGAYKWIRASANFHIDKKEWNVWYMTQFFVRFKKGESCVQENSIRIQRLLNDGETQRISVDAQVRNRDYDTIQIFFRNDNKGLQPCTINHLVVTGFN